MGRFLLLGHKVIDLAAVEAMVADDIPSARPRVMMVLGTAIEQIWLIPESGIEDQAAKLDDVKRQWGELVARWMAAREAAVSRG